MQLLYHLWCEDIICNIKIYIYKTTMSLLINQPQRIWFNKSKSLLHSFCPILLQFRTSYEWWSRNSWIPLLNWMGWIKRREMYSIQVGLSCFVLLTYIICDLVKTWFYFISASRFFFLSRTFDESFEIRWLLRSIRDLLFGKCNIIH